MSQNQSSAPDIDSHKSGIPRHVAIIMDGNNRWAKQRGLRGVEGHKEGARAVKATVESCARLGVEVLTVFAFSSENWRRPPEEVNALMELFLEALNDEVPELHDNGIRLVFIGDLEGFSDKLRSQMRAAMNLTSANTTMTFAVAVNYGGQWDITHAARCLAEKVAAGEMAAHQVTPEAMQAHMCLAEFPALDLMIRTGGERRISNFLLWQVAYAELYFSDLFWPDFNADALQQAFTDYAARQRRFGRTGDQVEADQ